MMWFWDFLVGAVTGVLSGFGVGGGTLLILWLTLVAGMDQLRAGGINLAYFAAPAVPALVSHIKNRLVDKNAFIFATITGIPICILSSIVASNMDVTILRRGFGLLLLIIGFKELFHKKAAADAGVDEKKQEDASKTQGRRVK